MKKQSKLTVKQWLTVIVFVAMVGVVGWQMSRDHSISARQPIQWEQLSLVQSDSTMHDQAHEPRHPHIPTADPDQAPSSSSETLLSAAVKAALHFVLHRYQQGS